MRRTRLALAASVAVTVATITVLVPAAATGPGGWDHVGKGSTAGSPALSGRVSALHKRSTTLYVGGTFTNAGGHANADRIAKWDGSAWSAIGNVPLTASDADNAEVRAIATYGDKIYVGGTFSNAGGNADADFLAVWNGVSWQPFCTPIQPGPAFGGNVDALQVIGTTLYVGGEFQNGAGWPTADYLVACDLTTGASSPLFVTDGQFSGPVYALGADTNGTLYAGGNFGNLANIQGADYVAAFDGAWHAVGDAAVGDVHGIIRSLAVSGTDLYIGSDGYNVANIAQADHVAHWDGSTWKAMGANTAGTDGWFPASAYFYAMTTSGSLVFAAGSFQNANGQAKADNIAYFDGTIWRPIGSDGAGDGPLNAETHALKVFRDDVYAGGNHTAAGGGSRARFLASYALRLPDNSISGDISDDYVGGGVYNTTGVGQTHKAAIEKGRHGTVYFHIQNDGLVPAAFQVKVTGSGSGIHPTWWRHVPSDVITQAVRDGTYSTGVLAPKQTILLFVQFFVEGDAANETTFTLTSKSSSGAEDTVRLILKTFRR